MSVSHTNAAPGDDFQEAFRRAKERQKKEREALNASSSASQATSWEENPLPFPQAKRREAPTHLEGYKTPLEQQTTAAVLENVRRQYGRAASARSAPAQDEQYRYAMEQYRARGGEADPEDEDAPRTLTKAERRRAEKADPALRKKKKHRRRITCCLLPFLLLVALAIAGFFAFQYFFGGLKTDDRAYTDSELGISSADAALDSQVTNIALFGVDSREGDDTGRSDATIILSIDRKNGKIKLTSIARDTYCEVPGYGKTKICHAYSYGGAALAMQTLNSVFDLNIRDYVTVNFDQMADIIDAVGGVEVEIDENELYYTNSLINYYVVTEGADPDPISSTGLVTLDGRQAVAYSRIRKESGGDDARTNRQRVVLEALLNKIKAQPVWEWPGLCKKLLPMMETSLGYSDIMWLSTALLGDVSMEMAGFPNENSDASGKTISGTWYYVYDLDEAKQQIYDFIYNDIPPVTESAEE